MRWAFNTSTWSPSSSELAAAMQPLPEEEQAACWRFHQLADRKRALISRLLQRRLGAQCFSVAVWKDVRIARTARGKPYFPKSADGSMTPQRNFNVSHEARFTLRNSQGAADLFRCNGCVT